MKNSIELVIFDLDNTLYRIPKGFDDAVMSNVCKFYKKYFGLEQDEDVRRKIKELRGEYGSNPRAFYYTGCSNTYFAEIFSTVEPSKYLKEDKELAKRLSDLKIKKVIFTNSPDFFANKVMESLGIRYLVDYVQYGNKCEPKPSPDGFVKIMRTFGVTSEQCLMVGDEEDTDMEPARRLGMRTARIGQSGNIYEIIGALNGQKV